MKKCRKGEVYGEMQKRRSILRVIEKEKCKKIREKERGGQRDRNKNNREKQRKRERKEK